ncbi:MarR family winged helix-turn-helix transcriptional regulator [Planctomycetota bacterium]
MQQQSQGGFLLAKIHQLGGRIFARLLKEYGIDDLNPAQGRIMFVLWRNDNIPINELARETKLGKSTLTSMLDRLEARGLIQRVPSKKDRRKILIQRTEADRSLETLYVKVSEEMARLWYQGFTQDQIKRHENDLQQILDNLTTYEATP